MEVITYVLPVCVWFDRITSLTIMIVIILIIFSTVAIKGCMTFLSNELILGSNVVKKKLQMLSYITCQFTHKET